MKRPKQTRPATASAPPPSPPPDPVNVIAQHWADLTGLSRTEAIARLVQIGHCHMKANRAGIFEVERELGILIGEQALKQEERLNP